MFKKNKKNVIAENSIEIENDQIQKDELQKCLIKLNLGLVENLNSNQMEMLNVLEGDLKRLENQLDDFIYNNKPQTMIDYSSILKLVDSNEKQSQNLKNKISQFKKELYQFKSSYLEVFQLDPSDLESKENKSIGAHLDDAKHLLAKLSDQAKREDVSQLCYKLNRLEKRLNNIKSENENDKRMENILFLLRSQDDQAKRQENDLNEYKRDLRQLKVNSFRDEFEKLYEKFEKKLQLLYSGDNDDPAYSLNDLIASIVELKASILNYEQFVFGQCGENETQIKNLEASRQQVLEDKNVVDSGEKELVLETIQLGIQAKQNELSKIKQISLVKDRILHLEKIFFELKAGLA
ncbi:hypothetical protein BpHYR1_045090 [Brachionus plicatilis]|uniref:Uncharacterized protein n=1 Tax=Brachionus plicatilis TaxID=10195 RepID=A0A3M7T066_BRAPC|nr:hypothetical protein BpHYR1_045090 [Brachionus plicatilis]